MSRTTHPYHHQIGIRFIDAAGQPVVEAQTLHRYSATGDPGPVEQLIQAETSARLAFVSHLITRRD